MIFRVKVWTNGQRLVGGLYLFALFWLTACGTSEVRPFPTAVSTHTQPLTPPPTPSLALPLPTGELPPTPAIPGVLPATATATAVPPITLSADPGVPQDLVRAAQAFAAQNRTFAWAEGDAADVQLTLADGAPLANWVYVVAAPFATVPDEISLAEVQNKWQQGGAVFATNEVAVLGQPSPTITFSADVAELSELAWAERPSLLILPFDALQPDLKLLRLDGVSPLVPDFDPASYPLTLAVNLVGEETAVAQFLTAWDGPTTNWDASQLTRVALSGVTALTRSTGYHMEIFGVLAPGRDVGPVLQTADIAHISNEVSFSPNCPIPSPIGGTSFCSRENYFELLTWLGVDVVELTGNHLNDFGTQAMLHSLDLYAAAGIPVYGGGADAVSAQAPALFEHNGNRIALIGCNPFGPPYAWAGPTKPGARPCDAEFEGQIRQLADDGYLVLATLQYDEFYHYQATAQQRKDFAEVIAAGATAVSGSQAHHAQGFAFVDGKFVHYGLGNLFFDQMDRLGTRQTFVDTYVIYNGRLLSVELWTGLIENYCCPREMSAAEREVVLTAVFQASDW